MARETMAALIARLRTMVNDPIGAGQQFTDDDLQTVLDDNREDQRQLELVPADTVVAGGRIEYRDYFSSYGGAWEASVVLQNNAWATITADSEELMKGAWHFNAHVNAPVYATGRQYDLNAAAADVIDLLMAKVAQEFDFSADGGSFQRSQKLRGLQALGDKFRAGGRIKTATLYRGDDR